MTLEEAIEQQISLGIQDPLTMVKNIRGDMGDDWWIEQLIVYGDDFVAQMARLRIGSECRATLALVSAGSDDLSSDQIRIKSIWIPEVGYKAVGKVTVDEWRLRGKWMMALAVGVTKQAAWALANAEVLEKHGVNMANNLPQGVALPPLPSIDDLDLPSMMLPLEITA